MGLASVLLQCLTLVAFASLAGGVTFTPLLLSSPKTQPLRVATEQTWRRWMIISLAAAFVASAFAVLPGATSVAFSDGRSVWLLLVRLLLLVAMAIWLWRRENSPWMVIQAAMLLLTQSILSRSAALPGWLAPTLADWFHLCLTSLWLGNVAMLAIVIIPTVIADFSLLPSLEATLDRFSPLAMFCVLGLGLSGIAQSANFLHGFDELITTEYGLGLSIKLGLFAVLIGFGAFHQQIIAPKLRLWRLRHSAAEYCRQSSVAVVVRQFSISLFAEVIVSAVLLLVVAVMKTLHL